MTEKEILDGIAERRKTCVRIAMNLRARGWDADAKFVNRHYLSCKRWDDGQLALGYMIKRTGLKRIKEGK